MTLTFNPLSFDVSSIQGPLLNHTNHFDDRIDMLSQVVHLNDQHSKGQNGDYTHATLAAFLTHMTDCGTLVESLMIIIENVTLGFQWTAAYQLHDALNCLYEVRLTYNNLKIHNPIWVMESPEGEGWRAAEAVQGKFYFKPIPDLFLEYYSLSTEAADAVNSLNSFDFEDYDGDDLDDIFDP